jgi:flagellar L-ring protein precursor FlgH
MLNIQPTRRIALELGAACIAALLASTARAQDGSLMQPQGPAPAGAPVTLDSGSFIYRELPPESRVSELKQHDIITVLVDYRTLMKSEGDSQARKTSNLTAVLTSWLRFDGKSIKLAPQNDGDPRVQGTYNSQSRAESDVELRDTLTFPIAAEIVEIRPNGNLYVEADSTVQANEERWKIFVSGELRRDSIAPDRRVKSESIIHLNVRKAEEGQVRDGYARGWMAAWYDKYKPF